MEAGVWINNCFIVRLLLRVLPDGTGQEDCLFPGHFGECEGRVFHGGANGGIEEPRCFLLPPFQKL